MLKVDITQAFVCPSAIFNIGLLTGRLLCKVVKTICYTALSREPSYSSELSDPFDPEEEIDCCCDHCSYFNSELPEAPPPYTPSDDEFSDLNISEYIVFQWIVDRLKTLSTFLQHRTHATGLLPKTFKSVKK